MALQDRMKTMAVARNRPQAAEEASAENRRSRRKSTTLPGLITFAGMRLTIPCTVADMSGTGARLTLAPAEQRQFGDCEHLPERLTLILRADRMQVDCEVRWRKGNRMGLRFLGPPKPLPQGR